jgi:hypothetical protein
MAIPIVYDVDIADVKSPTQRVLRGPGTRKPLVGTDPLMQLLNQRLQDRRNWYCTQLEPGHFVVPAATSTFPFGTASLTAALTFAWVAAAGPPLYQGLRATSTAAVSTGSALFPSSTGLGANTVDLWNSGRQPFCWARFLLAPTAATELNDMIFNVGLTNISVPAAPSISNMSASGAGEAARFLLTTNTSGVGSFRAETSVGGEDSYGSIGFPAAQRTSFIDLGVFLSKSRVPHYFVNSTLLHKGPACTSNVELSPRLGLIGGATATTARAYCLQSLICGVRYTA